MTSTMSANGAPNGHSAGDPAPQRRKQKHPLESAVIGVLAYNEEGTIEHCLRALLADQPGALAVKSVVVVASGCTDGTEEIVNAISQEDPRVKLLVERERSGKAAAINLLLRATRQPIVVMLGADVIVTPGALEQLLEPFRDPSVGMTGARPVPTNKRAGVAGTVVHILWELHHELSLKQPKLGEMVAFRRMVQTIDRNTLVDEAVMENVAMLIGLRLRYVATAVVRNHGPETIADFIAQRTRVYSGHLNLAAMTRYRVSSMGVTHGLMAAWRLWRRGEKIRYIAAFIALEVVARLQARVLRVLRKAPGDGVWKPIETSKRVVADGQVLRAHHDEVQTIQLRLASEPIGRQAAIQSVRVLIRDEDRLQVDGDRLTITIRADEMGADALRDRLMAMAQLIDTESMETVAIA